MIYTCPMHPEIREAREGMCPDCGMRLVPMNGHAEPDRSRRNVGIPTSLFGKLNGASGHTGHSTPLFFKKFLVSLILAIPVVAYSGILQEIFDWSPSAFPGSRFIPIVLGSVVFFYGGWIFLASAWREIRGRLPGMMTLIAVAITAAYAYSVYAFFTGAEGLFWELVTLIAVMLLGHWIEMRAVSGAQGALKELSKLLPDTAEVLRGVSRANIPLLELIVGDRIFVRPGGRIPADGRVIDGRSDVNEAMITGESAPVSKIAESEVIAGTVNGNGALTIEVTKIGEHTFLAGVMRLVREAQASKSRLQILSDRAAFWLTMIALGGGGVTFASWIVAGAGAGFALERFVAVLVIACPHALGVAIPLVASISTTMAARNGFLVRDRLALERARGVDVVLFDKTGTLTTGEYGVSRIFAASGFSERDVLRLAASVDAHSEHFISRAIVRRASADGVELEEVADFLRIPGKGVRGKINNEEIRAGGAAMVEEAGAAILAELARTFEAENNDGKTVIFVLRGRVVAGAISLADQIRVESRDAIQALSSLGVRVAMVTGDSEPVAAWVARELGIKEYFSRVLPGEKSEKVKALQEKGARVAMVGDGINDAPALVRSDVGIAIGAGTNVAIESAGIILIKNDPRDIPKIIRLSRLTYSKMIQNLIWATGYNVVAMPLAAGVLAPQGIMLEPAVAAFLMSVSTIIVAANAVLLRLRVL